MYSYPIDPYFTSPSAGDQIARGWGFSPQGNNEMLSMFNRVGMSMWPQLQQDASFQSGFLDPARISALHQFITQQLDPANVQAGIGQFNNQAQQQGAQTGMQLSQMMRGLGYGSGAQTGAMAGAMGSAQQQMAGNYQQQMSPEMQMQRLHQALGAIGQGYQSPALMQMQGLWNPVEQGHLVNQSEIGSGSAIGGIMNVLGTAAGAGMFKGVGLAASTGAGRQGGYSGAPTGNGAGMPPPNYGGWFNYPMGGS